MKLVSIAACALMLLPGCSQQAAQAPERETKEVRKAVSTIPLVIRSQGRSLTFAVEVARTPQEQAKGLMFRRSVADDGGMLFPMDPPRTASFWMEDTPIPLDMIFINTDGTIAFVAPDRKPNSREPISAGVPVGAVLELRGGRAAELGIREGDRVSWKE